MKIHPSITADRLVDLIEQRNFTLANPGVCIACGEDADGCEPDARNYLCEHCGERKVFGAEELLFHI